jgi:hypothetical protein
MALIHLLAASVDTLAHRFGRIHRWPYAILEFCAGPLSRTREALASIPERIAGIFTCLNALLRRRMPALGECVVYTGEGFFLLTIRLHLAFFTRCPSFANSSPAFFTLSLALVATFSESAFTLAAALPIYAEAFCMSPLTKDSWAASMDLSGSLDDVAAKAAGMAAIMSAAALTMLSGEMMFFISDKGIFMPNFFAQAHSFLKCAFCR